MSKREQEKAIEDTKKVAEEAKSVEDKQEAAETLQEVGQQAAAQEIQQTYRKSLDETKENVRKSIDEARTQIPKYANVVKSYQEQALKSTGKMVEDYINTQKSVMDSVFTSAAPYYENTYRMYSHWFSPRVPAELWARYVSNVVESISATARINNEILFGSIDAWRNIFERTQQHTQELSRINTNTARAFENTARETAGELSVSNRRREVYR
jgi:inorganic triphosphatase YgiF